MIMTNENNVIAEVRNEVRTGNSDIIADVLTRIRNGLQVQKGCIYLPKTTVTVRICEILVEEKLIDEVVILEDLPYEFFIHLKYFDTSKSEPAITDLKRISKPGCHIYVKAKNMPRVLNGMGLAIISTPEGIMTGHEATKKNLGGEYLCSIY